MSLSAFVLVDAILLIGNHAISEYLRIERRGAYNAFDLARRVREAGTDRIRQGRLPERS